MAQHAGSLGAQAFFAVRTGRFIVPGSCGEAGGRRSGGSAKRRYLTDCRQNPGE